MTTTFFGASVNSSPKGSAVWTLAAGGGGDGDWAVAGGSAGDLVSAGGGTGATDAAGAGLAAGAGDAEAAGVGDATGAGDADGLAAGEAEGAGDCASAAPPSVMATIGISAMMAARKLLIRFIQVFSIHPRRQRLVPIAPVRMTLFLTRKAGFRPMTDASCAPAG